MTDNQNQFSLGATLLDPTMQQNLADALGGVNKQITDSVKQREDAAGQAATEVEYSSKGGKNMMSVTVPADYGQKILEKLNAYDGVAREHQKLLDQNAQQIAQMKAHPFANTLAQIAASVAANDPNPLTRGIGQGAQRLNPTMQQLQGERMGMLGEQEKAIGGGLSAATSIARMHQDTKMLEYQRKLNEGQNKSISDLMNKSRLAVRPGSGQPLSYSAFVAMAPDTIPRERLLGLYQAHTEEAKLAAAGKEADVVRAEKKMTFKQGLDKEMAGVRGKIAGANRIDAINRAFQNSISPDAISAKAKIHEATKAIDETFATTKELRVLGPAVSKDLSSASKTNAYLGSAEGMLNLPEFADVQGPLFSYNKDAPPGEQFKLNPQAAIPKAFQSADRSVVMSQISHEIPRLLGLLLNGQAGGASILRTDIGKKLVQDMGITGGIRVDQARAILKIIRDTNNGNVAADMRAKPRANFGAIKSLLGATDPKNDYYFKERKDSFGNPLVDFPDPDQTGGGTTPSTTTAPQPATKKYPWEEVRWIRPKP